MCILCMGNGVFQSTTHQSRGRAHTEQPFSAISDFDTCLSASPSSRAAWYPRLEVLESTCVIDGSVIHVQFVSFSAINQCFSLLRLRFHWPLVENKNKSPTIYFWTDVFLPSSLLLRGNINVVDRLIHSLST